VSASAPKTVDNGDNAVLGAPCRQVLVPCLRSLFSYINHADSGNQLSCLTSLRRVATQQDCLSAYKPLSMARGMPSAPAFVPGPLAFPVRGVENGSVVPATSSFAQLMRRSS
jgi:hypothetical protein